jgi:hypothetical protein
MGWGSEGGRGPGDGPGRGGSDNGGGNGRELEGWGVSEYREHDFRDYEGHMEADTERESPGRESKWRAALKRLGMKAFELGIAFVPGGAVAQLISKAATDKFIGEHVVNFALEYMEQNPKAKPSEAYSVGLRKVGILDEMGPDEQREFFETVDRAFEGNEELFKKAAASKDESIDKWEYALTAEEKEMFDVIEDQQIDALTRGVNENVKEIAETRISQLTDRGVLQGNIGRDTLSKVYEDASDAIAQGSSQIRSQSMQNQLNFLSTKYTTGAQLYGQQLSQEWQTGESALDRKYGRDLADQREDALDRANKWNLFGNVASGIIESDWKDYF